MASQLCSAVFWRKPHILKLQNRSGIWDFCKSEARLPSDSPEKLQYNKSLHMSSVEPSFRIEINICFRQRSAERNTQDSLTTISMETISASFQLGMLNVPIVSIRRCRTDRNLLDSIAMQKHVALF